MVSIVFLLLVAFSFQESQETAWTCRGGPTRDFRLEEEYELTENFGEWGPKALWRRPLGDGYGGVLYEQGRLFVHFRDGKEEVIAALAAQTGKIQWELRYEAECYPEMDRSYGEGPNATPLILGERLFTIGVAGQLKALKKATGELLWSVELHERYGRNKRREEYGFSVSPIEIDGKIVVLVGGDLHGVVALNPSDGSLAWGSPPSAVSYAQATLIELDDGPQLVFFSPTAAIGMDPRDGTFLWEYPVENMFQNNLTPALHLGGRHVWIASQLDGKSRVLELPAIDSNKDPEVLWESRRIKQAHWDSFRIGDFVYGSLRGNSASFLAAVDWKTGEVAWKHRGFHLAKGVLAGQKFYFVDENGQLAIARFSPKGAEILDSRQLMERVSWTPPTLAAQVLYVRDRKHLVAVDLAPETYQESE